MVLKNDGMYIVKYGF
jgi:hydrocephalus-inducing protein